MMPERPLKIDRKALLLFQEGMRFARDKRYKAAIALFDKAVEIKPDYYQAWYHRGEALYQLDCYDDAVASYKKAIDFNPVYHEAWSELGNALSMLGRYKEALTCCDRALQIKPDCDRAWSGRGLILRMLGRGKEALESCDKALEINSDSYEAWTDRGLVLELSGRKKEAIAHFEKALEIQPHYNKAWFNKGILLLKLGRNEEALTSLQKALEIKPNSQGWYARGFALARLGRHEEAIDCFEKALEIKPDSSAAALYKLISLILTGKIFYHIVNADKRVKLFKEFKSILNSFKRPLLLIIALFCIFTYGQGAWLTVLKEFISTIFSVLIILLICVELWNKRSKLNLVWQIYFKSGILAYLRAFAIVTITLSTVAVVTPIVPSFMHWGWANSVFGSSGNVIFQPFETIKKVKPATSQEVINPSIRLETPSVENVASQPVNVPEISSPIAASFDYSLILVLVFWMLLILVVPFWANLEEKIFRQGANSWKQIVIRSITFGLIHITVGIPIFAGFIIIIPGFLFACRYKYVRDKYLRKTNDETIAQEAGVAASTADHAIYNAIIITIAVAAILIAK